MTTVERAKRRNVPKWLRRVVEERDGRTCRYCLREDLDVWHLDHIIPLARGGEMTAENLTVACPPCNYRKGAGDMSGRPLPRVRPDRVTLALESGSVSWAERRG